MFGKNVTLKNSKNNVFHGFPVFNMPYEKKRKPGNPRNQLKVF